MPVFFHVPVVTVVMGMGMAVVVNMRVGMFTNTRMTVGMSMHMSMYVIMNVLAVMGMVLHVNARRFEVLKLMRVAVRHLACITMRMIVPFRNISMGVVMGYILVLTRHRCIPPDEMFVLV